MEKSSKIALFCTLLILLVSLQSCKKDDDANAESAFSACSGGLFTSVALMENKVIGRFCSKYTRFYDHIGNKGLVYREQTGVVLDIRADHTLTIQADGKNRNVEWEITEISFQNDPKRYYLREKNSNTDVPSLPYGQLISCGANLMFSNIPVDGEDFLYVRM